jgi:hypothetical protein
VNNSNAGSNQVVHPSDALERIKESIKSWKFLACLSIGVVYYTGTSVANAVSAWSSEHRALVERATYLINQEIANVNELDIDVYRLKDDKYYPKKLEVHLNSEGQNIKMIQGFFKKLTDRFLILSTRYESTPYKGAYTETVTIPLDNVLYIRSEEAVEESKPN